MRYKKISDQNIDAAIEVMSTPFKIVGQIVPSLVEGKWTFTEVLFDKPREKTYKVSLDFDSYFIARDKVAFAAFEGEKCVAVIFLHRHWNSNVYVDNLHVLPQNRGNGVGKALMDCAQKWGSEHGLHGIMLETQDSNLLACRFYAKYGMEIGGVDTRFYEAFDDCSSETAIFWYKAIDYRNVK